MNTLIVVLGSLLFAALLYLQLVYMSGLNPGITAIISLSLLSIFLFLVYRIYLETATTQRWIQLAILLFCLTVSLWWSRYQVNKRTEGSPKVYQLDTNRDQGDD